MQNKDTLMKVFLPRDSSLKVYLRRGSSVESIHQVHAVVSDTKGRVLMSAGNPTYSSFIRSAFKPFQVLPFLSSGASDTLSTGNKGLAIACGSHQGTAQQARQVFKLLWNSEIEVDELQCPIPEKKKSRLEHNCSGKHAAFLATCKKMNWPRENYLDKNHPLQKEILRRVSEILKIHSEELVTANDDCGAPTVLIPISQMANLYAYLSSSDHPEIEQILRAMINYPDLISGTGGFDTELMQRAHGQIVSKGGSEGIQCIGRVGEGLGLAIKVEDGSKRAKHAVAMHLLEQLDWITPTGLEELRKKIINLRNGVELEVKGELKFQEI